MLPKPLKALLEEFLSQCQMNGTSITASGIKVSTNKHTDEDIIFFDIDSPEGRACLEMNVEGLKICDCLVFYSKETELEEKLCFLELKAAGLEEAKNQIISVHRKVKQILHTKSIQQVTLMACICMRRHVPTGDMRYAEELKNIFGRNNVHVKSGITKPYTKLGDDFLRK